MKYGHIVLSRSTNFDAPIIAFFTNSYFSHSFITAPPISNRLMVMEADAAGVTTMPFDVGYEQDDGEQYIMYEINIPQSDVDAGLNVVINELERSYGYLEIPWFAYRWLMKKLGKDIRNQDNWGYKTGTKVCSQFASDYLKAAGLQDLFKDFGNGSIVPQDIYEIILAHPELFKEVARKIKPGANV